MTVQEIRKIILENWGDINDIADKITAKDLLKVCDRAEGSEKMYIAIRESIRILKPTSRVRLLLENAIEAGEVKREFKN